MTCEQYDQNTIEITFWNPVKVKMITKSGEIVDTIAKPLGVKASLFNPL
jgi:hypothetical protein